MYACLLLVISGYGRHIILSEKLVESLGGKLLNWAVFLRLDKPKARHELRREPCGYGDFPDAGRGPGSRLSWARFDVRRGRYYGCPADGCCRHFKRGLHVWFLHEVRVPFQVLL